MSSTLINYPVPRGQPKHRSIRETLNKLSKIYVFIGIYSKYPTKYICRIYAFKEKEITEFEEG